MTNYSKTLKLFSYLMLSIFLIFQSCYEEKILTINFYIIDNQSSYELIYEISDVDQIDSILVPTGEVIEIDALGDTDSERITGDECFELLAKNRNTDVYLYRDSNGYQINALKLNTSGMLNWVEDKKSPNRFGNFNDFTLVVTDDMIQ